MSRVVSYAGWLIAGIAACLLGLVVLLRVATLPYDREWKLQDQKLTSLLSARASLETVQATLGTNCFVYSRASTNWVALQSFLRGRPDIAEAVGASESVVYYTTASLMTWIALDNQSRITNYFLCGQ